MKIEMNISCTFLLGSNINFYVIKIGDLENEYTRGEDNNSETLTYAYKLLDNWKKDSVRYVKIVKEKVTYDKVYFANVGDLEKYEGTSLTNPGRNFNIICFRCQ